MHAPTRLRLHRAEGLARPDDPVEIVECDPPGIHLQVPEVHRCVRAGLTESLVMPWSESLALLRTTDEVRRRIGLVYPWEG